MEEDSFLIPSDINRQTFFKILRQSLFYNINSLLPVKYRLFIIVGIMFIVSGVNFKFLFLVPIVTLVYLFSMSLILGTLLPVLLLLFYKLGVIQKLRDGQLSDRWEIAVCSIIAQTIFEPFESFEPPLKNIPSARLSKITKFLFSTKIQKEVFEPIVADWQEEYFEALFKKEIWKARWINVRYTYAYLSAMWQKSPLGDLIEFISKIAK